MSQPSFLYNTYDFCLESELVLPELLTTNAIPQVSVRLGEVKLPTSKQPNRPDSLTAETEVGKFFISAGREIVIEPAPRVEEAKLRLFLLGPIMALLLRQRGHLVLHASGVAINGGVVAFLGDAGWGKSTLAQAWCQRGYKLITDDVMSVQINPQHCLVWPSYPQVKLWPEAASSLGYVLESLPLLFSQSTKLIHRQENGFSHTPLPLKQIYILGGASPQHQIEPLPPQQAFLWLVRHSRAMQIPNSPDLDALHFRQCAELVKCIPIRRLQRQYNLASLPELINLIEADLTEDEEN
jgi:hypothetical protein